MSLHKNTEGKTLYCVAVENFKTQSAGVMYLHARNRTDVVNQLLATKQLRKESRVVAIAPAVGVWVTELPNGKTEVRM